MPLIVYKCSVFPDVRTGRYEAFCTIVLVASPDLQRVHGARRRRQCLDGDQPQRRHHRLATLLRLLRQQRDVIGLDAYP